MSNKDKIAQYRNNIYQCLQSNDNTSIEAAIRLLCGFLSRGHNLDEYATLIAKHVVSERDEIEILSQMLIVQISASQPKAADIAVELLQPILKNTKESRRLRAIKTISNVFTPKAMAIIESYIPTGLSDESSYVKKATIMAAAKLAKANETKKPLVINHIQKIITVVDPILLSGVVYACEIIGETTILEEHSDTLWRSLLAFDPWTQSRVLHFLRKTPPKNSQVLTVLLHSQNAAVVVEASYYLMDQLKIAIPPLIRLIYSSTIISVNAFAVLEKISRVSPDALVPYANHFLPPQPSEHTEFLAVKILGNLKNLCPPEILLRWALNYGNEFATHYIGELGNIQCLKKLLESGGNQVAEIAAYYTAKLAAGENGEPLLASLLEMEGPRAAVVSVFTETAKEHPELGELMLKIIEERYIKLGRETKTEAALLAARLVELNGSEIGKRILQLCQTDQRQDVVKRALILSKMIENEKMRKTVWASREPPPPSPPLLYLPEFE